MIESIKIIMGQLTTHENNLITLNQILRYYSLKQNYIHMQCACARVMYVVYVYTYAHTYTYNLWLIKARYLLLLIM